MILDSLCFRMTIINLCFDVGLDCYLRLDWVVDCAQFNCLRIIFVVRCLLNLINVFTLFALWFVCLACEWD